MSTMKIYCALVFTSRGMFEAVTTMEGNEKYCKKNNSFSD